MIHLDHDESHTGRFRNYTLCASLDNALARIDVGDSIDVALPESMDGVKHRDFGVIKEYLKRIRKRGGPTCRMKSMDGYCIVKRVA